MQAEQPEEPGGGRAQRLVRPRERGTQVGAGVLRVAKGVQPQPLIPQFLDDPGQGDTGKARHPFTRERQREWKPPAQLDEFRDSSGFGLHTPPADTSGQQRGGVAIVEGAQRDPPRAIAGDEAPHLVPAGHDHEVARAGQQRADLVGVAGVVQQEQRPAAREPASQQCGPFFHCGG